jgi:tetratricopeptide (TPR) repeat protein
MCSIKEIRSTVTQKFANNNFHDGDVILAENSEKLPNHVKLECLGNRYFYKKSLQEAINCYEEAINLAPDWVIPRYHYLVGIQEEKEGDFVAAFKRYQTAIESERTFVDPYVELGGLLIKVGDFKGALTCYRDAVSLDCSEPTILYNLKAVLEKMVEIEPNKYEEELKITAKAYELLVANHPIPEISKYEW